MEFIRQHLKNVSVYQPGKPIEEVQRELGLETVYKLASNENPLGPSKKAVQAMKNCAAGVHRYPDASCHYLRGELAGMLGVAENNLIFGNGSDEVIGFPMRAFVEPGQEVMVGSPTFLIYEIQAKALGLDVIISPLKNYRYDLDDMLARITGRTRLIYIANPDNPNGTYIDHETMERFLKKLPEHVLVFLDEAYCEFAPEDFPRSVELFKAGYNVIISRTFSKAYGLAGLRLGYACARPELISAMEKVREPFNVNLIVQEAARAALADVEHLRKVLTLTAREKNWLYRQLKKLRVEYVPSATNFILMDIKRDASPVCDMLLRDGIIVRNMKGWGYATHIRVTPGTRKQNRAFIASLQKALNA